MSSDVLFFFFKQKTAYELRISDWSSDVCSSDLSASVNLATERASVELLGGATQQGAVLGAIEAAGYTAQIADGAAAAASHETEKTNEVRRLRRDVVIAALLTLPLFVLEMGANFFPSLTHRSEERRVGKECVSPCRSRWS